MPLQSQFPGLKGNAATYRVISNARQLNSPGASISAVKADLQIASIPLVQYQVFYALDDEHVTRLFQLSLEHLGHS